MWTLITASEDTVAEILFAAHSTIREDESPLNQHFSILAPSSQRKEGRSIHPFIQATPNVAAAIHQGRGMGALTHCSRTVLQTNFRCPDKYGDKHPRGARE